MTGARLAAARQLTGPGALQLILNYVCKSVPDTLATLSPLAGCPDRSCGRTAPGGVGHQAPGLDQLTNIIEEHAKRNG